jgi:CubicO group peptidase (beta-lactamase class C family)
MNNVPRTGLIFTVILLISFNSFSERSEKLAPESTVEEMKRGYWDDPNVDYVSTVLPIDDEVLVDIRVMPTLKKGVIVTAPLDRNDGLIVDELGVNGGSKEMVLKLAQEMSEGQHGDFNSLLISHKGKFVFESYYLYGRLNLAHPQASATKTYTGLALGRAIQLGYLTMADLDKPVGSFLTELDSSKFVDGTEMVTLHQALTMHTGIRIINEKGEAFKKYRDQLKGQKLVQAIFEQSDPITSESQRSFSYGNYSTPLVMQVIEAVVPGTAEDFIKIELLGKMGIKTYEWRTGMGGLPTPGGKSSFSSRDMMKFGTLAINKGIWNGEQLIPAAYISKATSRVVETG